METSHAGANTENKSPRQNADWWYSIPVYNKILIYQDRAAMYTYAKQSNEEDIFVFRGASVNPKLSEFPKCKDIIQEYYRCREEPLKYQFLNLCGPLKVELSACVNLQMVKKKQKYREKYQQRRDANLEKDARSRERERELKQQKIDAANNQFVD